MVSVDLETKCYENDWQIVLAPGYVSELARRCDYDFAARRVIINNVVDRRIVSEAAKAAVDRKEIDEFVFAEDRAEEVFAAVGLTGESLGKGYVYSIAELVGAFSSKSDYLLHFSSDSYPVRADAWIASAIEVMQAHDNVLVANPAWNRRFHTAKAESEGELDNFYVGQGFSDQCYLVAPANFRQPIYCYKHELSQRYPAYGGELFEKLVDSFMRVTGRKRLTHRTAWYRHKNIPKRGFKRYLRELRPFL